MVFFLLPVQHAFLPATQALFIGICQFLKFGQVADRVFAAAAAHFQRRLQRTAYFRTLRRVEDFTAVIRR